MQNKPKGIQHRETIEREIELIYDNIEQLQVQIDNLKNFQEKQARLTATILRNQHHYNTCENIEQEVFDQ